MKRAAALVTVIFALSIGAVAAAAPAAPAGSAAQAARAADLLGQASDAISELHLDEAERLLAQVAATHPGLPLLQFEQSRLAFYRGSYRAAVDLADRAIANARGHDKKGWEQMRDLMAATERVTHDFERVTSANGRYVVSYPAGKDALLSSYALDVLAKADHALQAAFGIALPGPIRIEIYPSPETLAQVSALTVEQIQTTGTVALSKWNRLMITSPKALVRGYPWADTITHELVHMVVSRITGDRAPVWLQEGTAKLFERSWRERGAELLLDPPAKALLHDANAKNKLITFEQMYPSIAMLPSEDDAALAFAQVATFMQTYVEKHGQAALRDALARVEDGMDAREALGKAAAQPFAKIEGEWKASLPAKPEGASKARRLKPRFRVGDGPSDESTEVVEDDARRFLRIGDLLWDRGRAGAAALEYEKAHRADRDDPIVAARWARAALDAGNAHAAIEALEPQAARYPGHAPTQALLGAARLQLGERAQASAALHEAIWINPFDPDPHCNLARASDDAAEAGREQKACESLR
jgi:tetratricopeptide (TPR) repeat protein